MTGDVPFFQSAYYVTDIEEAARRWNRIYGAGPFFLIQREVVTSACYRGQHVDPADYPDLSHALGYIGDLQIQLTTQHDDRPSVFREMYAAGQEGPHHLSYLVDDFEGEYVRLGTAAVEPVTVFHNPIVSGVYFDTRRMFGVYTEFHTRPAALLEMFADWRHAHAVHKPGDPLLRSL